MAQLEVIFLSNKNIEIQLASGEKKVITNYTGDITFSGYVHYINVEILIAQDANSTVKLEDGSGPYTVENKLLHPTMVEFESGAKRTKDADDYAFHLQHPIPEMRQAKVWRTGSIKYGNHNWEKGIPPGETLNHLERHLRLWKLGDKTEDHLAHMRCNIDMLMIEETLRPENLKNVQWNLDGSITEEMKK